MRKRILFLLVAGVALAVVAPPAAIAQDVDCPQFATHEEAQAFFEAEGGPASDPHGLDADDDGLACETLPRADAVVDGELAATGADPWALALLGAMLLVVGAVAYRRSARSRS